MSKRIVADIILFFSIFFMPWYITSGLAILFMVLFPRFWEIVILGLILDSLFYVETRKLYGRFGIFTISALILLILIEKFKQQLRI